MRNNAVSITLYALPGLTMQVSVPTVCVTCVWAGVDKTPRAGLPRSGVFERRKILKMPHAKNPTRQVRALLARFRRDEKCRIHLYHVLQT